MYIQEIYKEWDLHEDATQIEICYKFYMIFVDIVDVETLVQTRHGSSTLINDIHTLSQWKTFQITKLIDQYKTICNIELPNVKSMQFSNIFEQAIFMIGEIANMLKPNNYKANKIETYYEPRLFQIAQQRLDINMLDRWVSMLSGRLFSSSLPTAVNSDVYNWTIQYNPVYLKNTVWCLENLLLSFRDVTTWYHKSIGDSRLVNQQELIINIMNHFIMYNLTNFYVKYYFEMVQNNFLENYNNVLFYINQALSKKQFALAAFTAIASFLNKLIEYQLIKKDDHMIADFLSIIKISCSQTNQEILQKNVFNHTDLSLDMVSLKQESMQNDAANSNVSKSSNFENKESNVVDNTNINNHSSAKE